MENMSRSIGLTLLFFTQLTSLESKLNRLNQEKPLPTSLVTIGIHGQDPASGDWVPGKIFALKPIFVSVKIEKSDETKLFEYKNLSFTPGTTDYPDEVEFGFRIFLVNEKGKVLFSHPAEGKDPDFIKPFTLTYTKRLSSSFSESYTNAYPHKSKIRVGISYRVKTGVKKITVSDENISYFEIPIQHIEDQLPPQTLSKVLTKKGAVPFNFGAVDENGKFQNQATTSGSLFDPQTGKFFSPGPFPEIFTPELIEEHPQSKTAKGSLLVFWNNIFDNLSYPFNGGRDPFFSQVSLILRGEWNESKSHPLVKFESETGPSPGGHPFIIPSKNSLLGWEGEWTQTPFNQEPVKLVDLKNSTDFKGRILGVESKENILGPGNISLKLPYDRTGTLYYGFYLKDAFGNSFWSLPEKSRFIEIRDDISPLIMASLKNSEEETFITWVSGYKLSSSGEKVPQYSHPLYSEKPLDPDGKPHSANFFQGEEDQPIRVFILAFDNIRISRVRVELIKGEQGGENFGFRNLPERYKSASKNEFLKNFELGPSDSVVEAKMGLNEAIIQSPLGEIGGKFPIEMVFTEKGNYQINFEAVDIFGNKDKMTVPIQISDTRFEMETLSIRGNRK